MDKMTEPAEFEALFARVAGKTEDLDRATKALLSRVYVKCHRSSSDEDLLTVGELATRLRCQVKEIYSLTRRRRANRGLLPLPHRKVGRRLLFSWRDVQKWLDAQPGAKLKGESR
jgi:hypothetical protein